jgi:hypothetical protein
MKCNICLYEGENWLHFGSGKHERFFCPNCGINSLMPNIYPEDMVRFEITETQCICGNEKESNVNFCDNCYGKMFWRI